FVFLMLIGTTSLESPRGSSNGCSRCGSGGHRNAAATCFGCCCSWWSLLLLILLPSVVGGGCCCCWPVSDIISIVIILEEASFRVAIVLIRALIYPGLPKGVLASSNWQALLG